MKKFLIGIVCVLLLNLSVLADGCADVALPDDNEDTVILNVQSKNNSDKTRGNKKSKHEKMTVNSENAPVNSAQDYSKYNPDSAYTKKTTSYKKEKKFKKMDVGAKYDTSFTPDSASQTRTLYTKYNMNEKMSVGASYKNETLGPMSNQMKGTMSVTPEYRLNQHFAVQNSFSKNLSNQSTKEEVSLKLNPFKDKERMDLNIGAGQVQYDNGSPSSSQINFGTNFRF